jgi:hypothetical protein
MKRAAVHWGIGRYLYKLDIGWADFCNNGVNSAKIENQWFKWNPPGNVQSSGQTAEPMSKTWNPADQPILFDVNGEADMQKNYTTLSAYIKDLSLMTQVDGFLKTKKADITKALGGKGSPYLADFSADCKTRKAELAK